MCKLFERYGPLQESRCVGRRTSWRFCRHSSSVSRLGSSGGPADVGALRFASLCRLQGTRLNRGWLSPQTFLSRNNQVFEKWDLPISRPPAGDSRAYLLNLTSRALRGFKRFGVNVDPLVAPHNGMLGSSRLYFAYRLHTVPTNACFVMGLWPFEVTLEPFHPNTTYQVLQVKPSMAPEAKCFAHFRFQSQILPQT